MCPNELLALATTTSGPVTVVEQMFPQIVVISRKLQNAVFRALTTSSFLYMKVTSNIFAQMTLFLDFCSKYLQASLFRNRAFAKERKNIQAE
jgi:hypothetical protein